MVKNSLFQQNPHLRNSFSRKNLQRYADEFAFRLNEGNCKVHTLDRIDALLAKSIGVRISCQQLVGA